MRKRRFLWDAEVAGASFAAGADADAAADADADGAKGAAAPLSLIHI